MILVDYRCSGCGRMHEVWSDSPPPAANTCPGCGAPSARRFAAVGLSGRTAGPSPAPVAQTSPALCSQYPQIPGLCHMSESAGRMWVARYRGDHRAVEAETARQETRAKERPPTMADAITHHHFSGSAPAEDVPTSGRE